MFSTKAEKTILVEQPIDVAYDTLIYLFPVKHYKLVDNDDNSHTVIVKDSSNYMFIMNIFLKENSPNTTLVHFIGDFPRAAMDLLGSSEKAINKVLEAYLIELDKKSNANLTEQDRASIQNSNIEVLNANNFTNPSRTETNSKATIFGYILCALTVILPIIALSSTKPRSSEMATLVVLAIVCLSIEICVAIILQFSENKKSIKHGRIQTVIVGILFILAGLVIHPVLMILGIIIPAISIGYFYIRDKH